MKSAITFFSEIISKKTLCYILANITVDHFSNFQKNPTDSFSKVFDGG